MARPFSLEEFDLEHFSKPVPVVPEPMTEQQKLDAFEQGYKAGWDDATAAQYQDQSRITAELENSLKDLAFTFHEARSHVLQGVEPLVRELVEKILPIYAQDELPSLVSERMTVAMTALADRPVVLCVSPASRAAVEAALPKNPGFPITIKEEDTLGDGQVFLNLGATEEMLDLDDAINSVQGSISDFFEINNQRMQVNG